MSFAANYSHSTEWDFHFERFELPRGEQYPLPQTIPTQLRGIFTNIMMLRLFMLRYIIARDVLTRTNPNSLSVPFFRTYHKDEFK